MPEREEGCRVQVAHLGPAAELRSEVGGRLPTRAARYAHRKPARRVDPAGEHPGQSWTSLFSGEERHDRRGQPRGEGTERVRPARHQHENDRSARREHGLQQLALDPRQLEVLGVAAFTGGPAPEQPGAVAEHDYADVSRRRDRSCRGDPGGIEAVDVAAAVVLDRGRRQLRPERLQDRRDVHSER